MPSSRRCARLLTTPVENLDASECAFLGRLAEIAPDFTNAGALAISFAALIRAAPNEDNRPVLAAWMFKAKGTALDAFVRGIERDYDAVLAGLVQPWSNGQVEGQINRLKLPGQSSELTRAGFLRGLKAVSQDAP